MIHPTDEESLQRILGREDIPEDVETEYHLWQSMYHRDGNSGPVGSIGLVAMARKLDYVPPNPQVSTDAIDWRSYPQDGSTRVEARFFGAWKPGVFLGFVEAGTMAVRLDDDDVVREARPAMVRLERGDEDPYLEEAEAQDAPQPVAQDAPPGERVWVEVKEGDDFAEGVLVGEAGAGGSTATVLLDGEDDPRDFKSELVHRDDD